MTKRLWAAAIAAAIMVCGSAAAAPTEVLNRPALERLKANKGVTLQWLWGAKPGPLTVSEANGVVALKGGQGPHEGDALTIDGAVTRIEAKTFLFQGRIVIVDNETREPCVRDGIFTFRITGARRFWRMKEQEARCAGRADLTDYVDIRF